MTKHEVLALLRQQTSPLSGQAIAEVLGISRTAVWKAVGALQKEGYRIDSVPRRGYVLVQNREGRVLTERKQALEAKDMTVRFADGSVNVTVTTDGE